MDVASAGPAVRALGNVDGQQDAAHSKALRRLAVPRGSRHAFGMSLARAIGRRRCRRPSETTHEPAPRQHP
jgi:hypothetical protein